MRHMWLDHHCNIRSVLIHSDAVPAKSDSLSPGNCLKAVLASRVPLIIHQFVLWRNYTATVAAVSSLGALSWAKCFLSHPCTSCHLSLLNVISFWTFSYGWKHPITSLEINTKKLPFPSNILFWELGEKLWKGDFLTMPRDMRRGVYSELILLKFSCCKVRPPSSSDVTFHLTATVSSFMGICAINSSLCSELCSLDKI